MSENFIPSATTQTMGTATKRWRSIYSTKIKTNDTFVNNTIVTFSTTIPDVEVAPNQYLIIQNGHIVSFILSKYPYDKNLLLRIQSHSSNSSTAPVSDYRNIPYSDFTITSEGLTLTNYDLTNMSIPIVSRNYGSISFLYVTSTGITGKLLSTLANIVSSSN